MKKILISDPVDVKCVDILKSEGYDVTFKPGLPADELKKIIGSYHGLIVRSETKADASLIALMDSMEVIGRAGAGVDNIDVPAATRKGILVMNTPGGNTVSAAEHTIALIMSMCRNIPQANHSMSEGKWERKKFTGTELFGKSIFIIGLGKIGREAAARCLSFGMKILAYDPVVNPSSIPANLEIEFVTLEEGFRRADIITLHVPLNENTRNLISEKTLNICKDGVKIINCARGGIVNENDILAALENGKVSSAAFDVFEKEPVSPDNPLLKHPRVICTPHLGASTQEAQGKVAVQIAEQVTSFFKNKILSGVINIPPFKTDEKLQVYYDLAVKIGYLHSKFLQEPLKEIKIKLSGSLLHSSSSFISAGVVQGFLSRVRTETINYINAPLLLKDSGISLSEIREADDSNYNNVIDVSFLTSTGETAIAGTVFGFKEQRIIKINEYLVEFNPTGNYLFYYNEDKPGVLAAVSGYLAKAGYNISGVSLGRVSEGSQALSIIGVDSPVTGQILKEITGINGIINRFMVNFHDDR
jgi:D-3-phosphoglycerate dehydrogenase / 2-oxoglutarate reductase